MWCQGAWGLWRFAVGEVRRGHSLADEARFRDRRQKFYVFLRVPVELERFLAFAFLHLTDAFLFVLTLLPLRVAVALATSIRDQRDLGAGQTVDVLRLLIVVGGAWLVGAAMLYHIIKSQSVIKLYIFFNMLEATTFIITKSFTKLITILIWY